MKLELKFIAPYLAHGIKFEVIVNDGYSDYIPKTIIDNISALSHECICFEKTPDWYFDSENESIIKPLLLPLSALTEPLEDGSIPIVELAKIHDKFTDEMFSVSNENDGEGEYFMCHYLSEIDKNISCHFVVTDKCDFQANALFHNSNPSKYQTIPVNNQLQLFEYLYSIHADIYGLIDAGLAIDKRTIKSD